MSNVSIREAIPDELPEAAYLASLAMISLPDNNAVFAGKRSQFEAAILMM